MDEMKRKECTPQEYIRELFAETKDGKLSIKNKFYGIEPSYTMTYEIDWTEQDVELMVKRYDDLVASLEKIGKFHDELEDEVNRKTLITVEDFAVWETYIRPFGPFEYDEEVINELYIRRYYGDLNEQEYELLEKHHEWFEANSLKRLPFNRCSPLKVINRAQRYEYLIRVGAPKDVIAKEGRCLAEELILYYHSVHKEKPDLTRFIEAQVDTYLKALEEIKNGKKCTHWMWYIFPQMRGLGISDMSRKYGIENIEEAKAYLAEFALGTRLRGITEELLKLEENDPKVIFGDVDAMKLQSSMTLFATISEEDSVFHKALEKFFDGEMDSRTLEILNIK